MWRFTAVQTQMVSLHASHLMLIPPSSSQVSNHGRLEEAFVDE